MGRVGGRVPLPQLSLEDLSPAFVLYLADATFLQHVVTDAAEHFKLLKTGEFSAFGSLTDDLEKASFEHWSLASIDLL